MTRLLTRCDKASFFTFGEMDAARRTMYPPDNMLKEAITHWLASPEAGQVLQPATASKGRKRKRSEGGKDGESAAEKGDAKGDCEQLSARPPASASASSGSSSVPRTRAHRRAQQGSGMTLRSSCMLCLCACSPCLSVLVSYHS